MFGDKLIIKKYPYLGYSENLIEYFGIIGYSEIFIPELISSLKQKQNINLNLNNNNQFLNKNICPYPPTVLSSITSKNDYGIVDNELIITQLYPDNPKIFLYEQNQQEPDKSNVIYSFCFDSTDGQKKLFYTCFGYKFYELYKDKDSDDKYYIPKAFCIISQYPFFNSFYMICNNLYDTLINKKNIVPVEILLYNIVNYIPSPINNKLELSLFTTDKEDPKIEINQLNGFPNLDFDLFEIFNLLPLNLIIEIYVLTFLEQSILFFSANLELLNTIMYIMYMFNYPCNDSTYFWHIVSVGKNNLIEENKFVGKLFVSLLGVNCSYDSSIDTSAFGESHYVVDIDNKKLFFKETLNLSLDEKEDSSKLNNLITYIDNILRERNVNSSVLKPPLVKLKNNISNYLNERIQGFTVNPKKNYVNFFKMEQNIKNTIMNVKLLEFFYDCNLTLLMNLYNDNQLTSSFDTIRKEENISAETLLNSNKFYEEEEKYFFDLFRNSVKYKIYFDNFMSEFEVMDVFKIPFLFSRMFIELKLKDPKQICCENISYFSIIDHLYRLNMTNPQLKKINFNKFNHHFIEKIGQYFKRFYINDNDNKIFNKNEKEEIGNTGQVKEEKYELINLNKKIINRYIYLLQNLYEANTKEELFPFYQNKEFGSSIKLFDNRIIYQLIKNKLIEKKFISPLNCLIYALTYVVSLTVTLHPFEQMIAYLDEIQNTLKLIKYFMPHYIYTLIKSIYKYYLINKNTRKYPNMILTHVKMYFYFLANFIRSQFIVPNEEMMYILKNFFSDIIFQERKEISLEEGKKIKSNTNEIINNNNNNTNTQIKKKENIDVYKNNSYIIFMKYCFNGKKMFKSKTMIEKAMLELDSSNVVITIGEKIMNPQIVLKINDYIYKSKFYTPRKLFKEAENMFEDLFDKFDLDLEKLNIDKLREIILNLIQYGLELKDIKFPVGYLMNTFYYLKNFESIIKSNNNNDTNNDINIK